MVVLSRIIFAVAITFAVPAFLDFVIYSCKSAPKNATMTTRFWFIGFVCSIYVIYRMLP